MREIRELQLKWQEAGSRARGARVHTNLSPQHPWNGMTRQNNSTRKNLHPRRLNYQEQQEVREKVQSLGQQG